MLKFYYLGDVEEISLREYCLESSFFGEGEVSGVERNRARKN